jgi:ribonuclease P protein component
MLSAQNRLAKKRDIEQVFKTGRSTYLGDLGMRFCPNGLAQSRFTVLVSLKVHKKATKRNLLKRRLREILRREIVPRLHQSVDGIIMTRKGLLGLEFDELKALMIKLFNKARLV